ncbi:MAG: SIS domain-containing protein, partial [Erysipelotrichaceae bacterium]
MCGIVGFIGLNSSKIVKQILDKMRYRGYDSCGIAGVLDGKLSLEKTLLEPSSLKDINSWVCVGHTRWATHGEVNIANCHPHVSNGNKIALVHNGIVENYLDLKQGMPGIELNSDTDTEVLVNQIGKFEENNSLLTSIFLTTLKMSGQYAFLLLEDGVDDKIYYAKNGSSLILCRRDRNYFIVSDVSSVIYDEFEYAYLPDGCYGYLELNDYVCELSGLLIELRFKKMKQKSTLYEQGYNHMYGEIMEQKDMISRLWSSINLDDIKKRIISSKEIILIGSGSSYHACLFGKTYIEKYLDIRTTVYLASVFSYEKIIYDKKSTVIVVSQSGETQDVIKSLKNIDTYKIGITNGVHSTIYNLCDYNILMNIGPEIAVASTKSMVASIYILYLIASINRERAVVYSHSSNLNTGISDLLDQENTFSDLDKYNNIITMGKGLDYYACLEGALKIKEITYTMAFGIDSGELKHGTIALIDEDLLTIAVSTNSKTSKLLLSNLEEVKSRGGKHLLLSAFDNVNNIGEDLT